MARILLVDDDVSTRDLLKRALESDGHVVETAGDGAEALDRLSPGAKHFDLLFTDLDMPVLSGMELAEQASAQNRGLKIILMSGFPDQLDRASRVAARRLGTLAKPFTIEQARSIVRTVLG